MRNWKKLSSAALAAMVMATVMAGCGGGEKKADKAASDTIKIGSCFELTGNVAIYGKAANSGLKLAVEEINAKGGVNGKKLEIVESDNKSEHSLR